MQRTTRCLLVLAVLLVAFTCVSSHQGLLERKRKHHAPPIAQAAQAVVGAAKGFIERRAADLVAIFEKIMQGLDATKKAIFAGMRAAGDMAESAKKAIIDNFGNTCATIQKKIEEVAGWILETSEDAFKSTAAHLVKLATSAAQHVEVAIAHAISAITGADGSAGLGETDSDSSSALEKLAAGMATTVDVENPVPEGTFFLEEDAHMEVHNVESEEDFSSRKTIIALETYMSRRRRKGLSGAGVQEKVTAVTGWFKEHFTSRNVIPEITFSGVGGTLGGLGCNFDLAYDWDLQQMGQVTCDVLNVGTDTVKAIANVHFGAIFDSKERKEIRATHKSPADGKMSIKDGVNGFGVAITGGADIPGLEVVGGGAAGSIGYTIENIPEIKTAWKEFKESHAGSPQAKLNPAEGPLAKLGNLIKEVMPNEKSAFQAVGLVSVEVGVPTGLALAVGIANCSAQHTWPADQTKTVALWKMLLGAFLTQGPPGVVIGLVSWMRSHTAEVKALIGRVAGYIKEKGDAAAKQIGAALDKVSAKVDSFVTKISAKFKDAKSKIVKFVKGK